MTLVDTTTGEVVAACTPDEARALTDRIKGATEALWSMLAEANDRQAWRALGYGSFREYAAAEFNISQGHAYRMLDQAKVIAALAEAAQISPAGEIVDGRTARDLIGPYDKSTGDRPRLAVVKDRVAEAVAELDDPDDRAIAAREAVELIRDEIRETGTLAPTQDETAAAEAWTPNKPDLGDGISHPARYSPELLPIFADLIGDYACDRLGWEDDGESQATVLVLDPFAGTGRIHELSCDFPHYGVDTIGIELEPEWASLHECTICGSATDLLAILRDELNEASAAESVDIVCTSPTYGNRLADSHNASDPERRRSYTHDLGRPLSDGSSGAMQWGADYQNFHEYVWKQAVTALKQGGRFILNIKDHIRGGAQMPVSHWHVATLVSLGLEFRPELSRGVQTGHLRQGANPERAGQELVLVFDKGVRL